MEVMIVQGDETDVLVIGAGLAGGAVSKRLSDRGIRVICLEQGDWLRPEDYPHESAAWEFERTRRWHIDPNVRRLPEDYPVTGGATAYMHNGVGGSTVHFGGMWSRYTPSDFRKGTEHGLEGTIDWPLSYEELAPYYELNDREVGISGIAGDCAFPSRQPRYSAPIPPGLVGVEASRALERLNWHWWPADLAILSAPKDGRKPCNLCGNCRSGCPRGSLGSADHAYWPAAIRNGVQLRVNARVEQILTQGGRATGAVYVERETGQRHRVRARVVVVCANGIGTPRLLLISASSENPDGLANSNGLVGHYLMHHNVAFTDCWLDRPLEGFKGSGGPALYSMQFYETDASRGFVNGFGIHVTKANGAAYSAFGANATPAVPWGAQHHAEFGEKFGRQLVAFAHAEDLPVFRNAVTLDESVTDSSGLPAARVDYSLHENDRRLMDYGEGRLHDFADALGATAIHSTGVVIPAFAVHLMGTCRMGGSPADSVTNKYNQAWDVPNLFIADSSALTTGAAVTPSSTIGALALRCADYIRTHHRAILEQRHTPTNREAPALAVLAGSVLAG